MDESNRDGTDRLCWELYRRDARPRDYIGGSSARMLHHATELIRQLSLSLAAERGETVVESIRQHVTAPPSAEGD